MFYLFLFTFYCATRKFSILCMAGIIYPSARDVLGGLGGQLGNLGLALADNRLITDSKAEGNRIKAASQEGQAGRDI